MLSIRKTLRCEYSAKTLVIMISMYEAGKSHLQIDDHLKLAKSTVNFIIHRHNSQLKHLIQPTQWISRLFKFDDRAKRLFICHIEQNP